ncbi:MAG TPA: tetratricopeptide repeat protein [Methylocystis sp.]|nr:tetratricopeptide repeat protein [Methylocystis sp.]
MSDIFQEVDEEVQRDKIEKAWSRYQTPMAVVALLIVAATAAWTYYSSERLKTAQAANARYASAVALADAGKSAEAVAAFDAIVKDGSKGYAALARLRAAEEIAKTDRAKAVELFEAMAEDKNVDKLTQEVAKLRAALIAANEEDRGEKLMLKLGPLMTQNGLFRFTAQELTGLDSFFNEDYDEAERVFNLLQNDPAAPAGARQRAAAWQGLLHSVRGVKKGPAPGEITSVTPVIEPADGTDPRDAPAVTIEKK